MPQGMGVRVPPRAMTSRMDTTQGEGLTWIKADFHLHTAEDVHDAVDYTALELIEHAHQLGFGALAITLHDRVFSDPEVTARARELGILLIPGGELRIEGADVVVLNISAEEAAGVRTFADLRRLRAGRGASLLTFAPHPFYGLGGSIGARIEEVADCFDALEYCHFHVPLLNPNARAERFARRAGKPLLATSDAHRRVFFGEHYSRLGLAEATPGVEGVFAAIRAGRIRRVCPTGGLSRLCALLFFLFVGHPLLKWLRRCGARPAGTDRPRPEPLAALAKSFP